MANPNPKPGPGRAKGSQNKTTTAAKEAFQFAFDKIGGNIKLAEWANLNQTEFYKLYGRLIPVEAQHSGKDGGDLSVIIKQFSPLTKS